MHDDNVMTDHMVRTWVSQFNNGQTNIYDKAWSLVVDDLVEKLNKKICVLTFFYGKPWWGGWVLRQNFYWRWILGSSCHCKIKTTVNFGAVLTISESEIILNKVVSTKNQVHRVLGQTGHSARLIPFQRQYHQCTKILQNIEITSARNSKRKASNAQSRHCVTSWQYSTPFCWSYYQNLLKNSIKNSFITQCTAPISHLITTTYFLT